MSKNKDKKKVEVKEIEDLIGDYKLEENTEKLSINQDSRPKNRYNQVEFFLKKFNKKIG